MQEKTENIALWGYGIYGKRTAESMKKYWGNKYNVVKIYDIEKRAVDPWWKLEVSDPGTILKDYHENLFKKVFITISDYHDRKEVEETLKQLDIPWFFPGKESDVVPVEKLEELSTSCVQVQSDDYSLYCLRDMMGAVSDYDRSDVMYIFNENGIMPEETVRVFRSFDSDRTTMLPFRLAEPIPERKKLEGQYCVLAKQCSGNYWHFTFQSADCVFLLEQAGYKGKYIINGTESNLALMHMLGVNDSRIIKCGDLDIHKVYVFEELILLNHKGHSFEYSVETVAGISEAVKRSLVVRKDAAKRLYVSRIGKRKLLNGIEIAKKLHFTIFVPEEHSLMEQMEAFYNADIVLTPHGANSTNCIYMRKGAVFAELFSSKWHFPINRKICEQIGINYLEETGFPEIEHDNWKDGIIADYSVDETRVIQMINKAEKMISIGNNDS